MLMVVILSTDDIYTGHSTSHMVPVYLASVKSVNIWMQTDEKGMHGMHGMVQLETS